MKTRLMLMGFCTIFVLSGLTGCIHVEKGVAVEKEAVNVKVADQPKLDVQEGAVRILDGGVNPKLLVQKGAVCVQRGAVEIKPTVEKDAVNISFKIDSGAITFMPGAIQFNLGSKGPPMDVAEVKKALEQLKPLGSLAALPEATRNQIIINDTILQETIKVLLKLIEDYNKNYTTGKANENKDPKTEAH